MRKIFVILFAAVFPALVLAQSVADLSAAVEDDRGFLTGLLERNLSGEGRSVRIEGFQGALSSRATFDRLVIEDEDGAWLTLLDGAIQWNRSALLRRRVEIAELSAQVIQLPRLPGGGKDAPQAEARPFALPSLPVALNIEKILAERVELGEPVIGQAAALKVQGGLSLEGGEGNASLTIDRLDGPRGQFVLDAGYNNETRIVRVNLGLDEAADGLLVNIVNLHDKPAVVAQISGEGPLDSFAADIRLATDGQPRVTGTLSANAGPGPDGAPGTAFRFQLGGDVASLVPPRNRAFFGTDAQLRAEGWRGDTGRILVPVLSLQTEALSIDGALATNDKGGPQSARLEILLGRDAGATQLPVALPGASPDSTVESGRLRLQYDASAGAGWSLTGRVGQLNTAGAMIGALVLDGSGEVVQDQGALSKVTGQIEFAGQQMQFRNPGVAQAVGDSLTGRTRLDFTPGNAAEFSDVTLEGADYGLEGYFLVSGLSSGITLSIDTAARYEDLSRLSTLAGRPLTGRADADIRGYYTVLGDGFDLDARVTGTDIALDQAQLDRLLAGSSAIAVKMRRDETGIELDNLSVDAQGLTARAQGYLNSTASDVTAQVTMPSLASVDPAYAGSARIEAQISGPAAERKLQASGLAEDLALGIEQLDRALRGRTELSLAATRTQSGAIRIETLTLANPQLSADAQGNLTPGQIDAVANLSVPDLAVLGEGWAGDIRLTGTLREADGTRLLDVTGRGTDLRLGQASVDNALTGATDLVVRAEEKAGVVTLRDVQLRNAQMNATAAGVYGPGVTDLSADVDIASLAPFGPGWRGALVAQGSFAEAGDGVRRLEVTGTGRDLSFGQAQVDGALAGETRLAVTGTEKGGVFDIETAMIDNPRLSATASGRVGGGQSDVSARVNARDLRFLGNGFRGAVSATAELTETDGARRIVAQGTADGLAIGQTQADAILRGQTSLDVAARQTPDAIVVERLDLRNPQLTVTASGDAETGLAIDARLADLGLIQRNFPGPATVQGTVRPNGNSYAVDLSGTAPGDTRLQVTGTAATDFSTVDLAISGATEAAIANSFLRTRSIEGPIAIDVRMNGAPGLAAISGRVALQNGSLSEPGLGVTIEALDVTADLNGPQIQLTGSGNVEAGGRIELSGPISLANGRTDLDVRLRQVVARDPNLYRTVISGDIEFSAGGGQPPLIEGTVDIGETEIRIPSTGLGGAKAIPDITHVGDTRPVRATRAKAGLEPFPSAASADAGMAGPPATPASAPPRLNLTINAPNQVFVRGRGVDAEMGGSLQVQGTPRNVIPIGQLELIRGRVDLLGKRFDLTEGLVELQGSLMPVIRLIAETEQDGITTRVIIDGEVRDPDITFEASPDMPEEEVLSQLLFGRGLDNISALQAAQLANALAVLAGGGSSGLIGDIRRQTGLDDLDLATDDNGNVQLRAGKYLSDNLYTDVSVGDSGTSTLNLNLDVTDTIRARGSAGSDGGSTLGLYFERDY